MSYQLASREGVGEAREAVPTDSEFGLGNVVGESPALLEARRLATKVANRRDTTVLLVGDTGTGKELFARGIHYAGATREEPFVAVNCAAIPESLLESELFGHERGAFTDAKAKKRGLLELAGSGTLFLDEVGDLPPNLQPKLLRVLEERKVRRVGGLEEIRVRCRIIAASNASLESSVADGAFREDLFYRLNVFRIALPALSGRGEDVLLLARHFLDELAHEQGYGDLILSAGALGMLTGHDWPGNVRELKNVIERAAILADGPVIEPRHLRLGRHESSKTHEPAGASDRIVIPPQGLSLDEIEKEAFRITLARTGWNKSEAARILEVSRPTVQRKIEKYALVEPEAGEEDGREART